MTLWSPCVLKHVIRSLVDPTLAAPIVSISFPEPTCLLVSIRVLVLTKRHVGSGNEIAIVCGPLQSLAV